MRLIGVPPQRPAAYPVRVLHTPNPAFFIEVGKLCFGFLAARHIPVTEGQVFQSPSSTLKSRIKTLAYKDARMIITLTESEQMIVNYVARCRHDANVAKGTYREPKDQTMTAFEVDQQGFGGELAFCKAMNVFPDLTVFCRSALKGQDNGDCTVQGLRIDVKTSKKATSALWVKEGKKGCADAFALVTGTFPTFTVVGLASHDMVFVKGRKFGDQFVVDQDKLIHPDVFFSPVFF